MKKLTFLFSILFVAIQAQAQTPPEMPAPPTGPVTTIEFEEPIHEFGKINQGEKVEHVFTFTNTGEKPLIISNAKGSCGCTVPEWPREPIMVGETGTIKVIFSSKGKRGLRNQKVTLTANTTPPQTVIALRGEVLVDKNEEHNHDHKGHDHNHNH